MKAQQRWYRETLQLKGEVVADAGANVGALSQFFFEAVGPRGRVVSIEPIGANIKAIEKRINKARAGKRWSVKKCAVSAEVGKINVQVLRTDWGTNSMVSDEAGKGKLLAVDCRPLADLVPDATVVKLDIEGHEYAVIPGALEALPKVHSWALELHGVDGQSLGQTLARFAERGYSLFAAGRQRGQPDGPWVSVPITPALSWEQIPGTPTVHDGVPGLFKMLHVIAKR